MILQVHDELLFEGPEKEIPRLTKLVKEVMEGVHKLRVPLVVDTKARPQLARHEIVAQPLLAVRPISATRRRICSAGVSPAVCLALRLCGSISFSLSLCPLLAPCPLCYVLMLNHRKPGGETMAIPTIQKVSSVW